jgi:hypothetical protein
MDQKWQVLKCHIFGDSPYNAGFNSIFLVVLRHESQNITLCLEPPDSTKESVLAGHFGL